MTTKANDNPASLTFQSTQIKKVKTHEHLDLNVFHLISNRDTTKIDETKANKNKLTLLKRLKLKLDHQSLEISFMSFIRPTLAYADCIWAGTYDIELSKRDKVQIEAMRMVSGAVTCSYINNLYEEFCWPSLGQRRIEHI